MGFKSVMKKIGHVALKTAPLWMSVVPGVGTAAGMALSGAAGVADKKLSGGSWKSSLLNGGLSAGAAFGADKAGGLLGKFGGKAASPGLSTSIANPTLAQIASGAAFDGGSNVAASTSSSLLGKIGNYLGKNPELALGALSLLGGSGADKSESRSTTNKPFTGFAKADDAQSRALQAVHRSGQAFFERPNRQMSALLPSRAAPVDLPGLGVRIGGGSIHNSAMDPMTVDREYLQKYDPMQSVGGVDEFRKSAAQPKSTAQPRRM